MLLVVNCDLESECVDSELRVALQWIAASELGLPTLYFRKSREKRVAKVRLSLQIKTAIILFFLWLQVVQFPTNTISLCAVINTLFICLYFILSCQSLPSTE